MASTPITTSPTRSRRARHNEIADVLDRPASTSPGPQPLVVEEEEEADGGVASEEVRD